jgi:hypothetical protein
LPEGRSLAAPDQGKWYCLSGKAAWTIHECLDWQNSQFINIVGKDDNSAAIEVK